MAINLPTKLTLLRLVLVAPFLFFMLMDSAFFRILACLTFGAAGLTDYFDGKLARKHGCVTTTGKFLDPLADKFLISAALITFVQIDEVNVPAWMVVLIIGREFLITGLRTLAVSKGRVLPAQPAGKFKTTSQIVCISLILLVLVMNSVFVEMRGIPKGMLEAEPGFLGFLGWIGNHGPFWFVAMTTLLTIVSGYMYINDNRDLFRDSASQK